MVRDTNDLKPEFMTTPKKLFGFSLNIRFVGFAIGAPTKGRQQAQIVVVPVPAIFWRLNLEVRLEPTHYLIMAQCLLPELNGCSANHR